MQCSAVVRVWFGIGDDACNPIKKYCRHGNKFENHWSERGEGWRMKDANVLNYIYDFYIICIWLENWKITIGISVKLANKDISSSDI